MDVSSPLQFFTVVLPHRKRGTTDAEVMPLNALDVPPASLQTRPQ